MDNWRYCVAANIVDEHVDDTGVTRHGTIVFPSGRKVYISRRFWRTPDGVTVMGLNRFKSKYVLERVPLAHIINIRAQKVFKPRVLELMCDDIEHHDMWWGNTEEDHLDAQIFAAALRTMSSPANNSDDEWLIVSEDGCTLNLCPYTGMAWQAGRQIIKQSDYLHHPYMNGYCWSSMVKYYLRSKGATHLLKGIEMLPEEHVCIFRTHENNAESINQLIRFLRDEVTRLPAWIIESEFDEWDDWG